MSARRARALFLAGLIQPPVRRSDPPAIVLGGSANAVSVARSLAPRGIRVHALGSAASPVRYSRHCRSFADLGTGVGVQERWLAWLDTGPREGVLLPCDDHGLQLVARNRPELEALGYTPIEANDEVLLAMLDKERTYALAAAAGVETPWSVTVRSLEQVDAVLERATYPCVLKPVHAHLFRTRLGVSAKVLVADDRRALRLALERTVGVGLAMMLTDRVPGGEDQYCSYYSYLDADGQPLLHFNRHKQRQYPVGFGTACHATNRHDPEASELGLRFFQAVGLRGLANVEFKRDARDGRLKLIECNHRFTAADRHSQLCGLDLPLFVYNRLTGRELPPVGPVRTGVYLWHPIEDTRACLALRARGELSLAGWARSLCHPVHFPVASWADPMPTVGYHAGLALRAARTGLAGSRPEPAETSDSHDCRPIPDKRSPSPPGLAGRARHALAVRVETVRFAGVRYGVRRLREESELARIGMDRYHSVFRAIWKEAADALGADLLDLPSNFLEIGMRGTSTRVWKQWTDLDDAVSLRVAEDKPMTHILLARAGLAVPGNVEFTLADQSAALAFLLESDSACVVKPASGMGGGAAITTEVRSASDLARASVRASRFASRLLVERQIEGHVYRFLYLDGRLLDVVRREPPRVVGDGRSTLEQLIAAENRRRLAARGHAGFHLLRVDLDCILTLRRAGLKLSHVPGRGALVQVKTVTNQNRVEDNETVRETIDGRLVAEGARAAAGVGIRLAGVDLITTDLSRPLSETGGAVTEVNGTPGLNHHYQVVEPARATRVAIPILRTLLGLAEPPTPLRPVAPIVQDRRREPRPRIRRSPVP